MAIGFGIVGFGKMAEIRHKNCINQVGGKLVAVCDPLPSRREMAVAQGAKAYEDYDAFLAVPSTITSVFAALSCGVHARDCDDYASGLIRFANGTVAVVEINFMTRANLPAWNVVGEKGTLQSGPGGLLLHDADGERRCC